MESRDKMRRDLVKAIRRKGSFVEESQEIFRVPFMMKKFWVQSIDFIQSFMSSRTEGLEKLDIIIAIMKPSWRQPD